MLIVFLFSIYTKSFPVSLEKKALIEILISFSFTNFMYDIKFHFEFKNF